ncbi:MAG TPA: 16S rRNA (uracil(1498)-N(3))-methyltransferase [Thermoclostridium caenicola]|uniref:Ribosomal RNA small subunit methyltransferase E n=1 Tax=Thermoclostridium caenicola TaxID=659425 RepID=A0A1M6B9V0_9FIRM|nr:16S rRNA (uracil(1498)-N(3))-methyltransferase [Thermoclostridium caenicola]SHI45358.1 16S rRNA (uracil1498-N3)-methyltransferase [Thermoclostridium caenicola]HOK43983.1 16S rRNA (uracil(1498)-N(3))-methyltransferase [Thermoclostridium caenicola]HOL83916.1 16S rRNA (uracil(1498)-N(3))-methyltransferase [Thermoclostridium caenicola]HOP71884.1 16S rRNA (uracil(1498)-N(3))-methyltransferase [Thermoclostridium caenicola]HPO76328.1 16S rRNA (uracil(1498)-N(3))-methyltransferase [Thermoclostridiu
MHRFMVNPGQIGEGVVSIQGSDLKHLSQVLRLGKGDIIQVFDGNGMEYTARLTAIGRDQATAVIMESHPAGTEPCVRLTLYQGLPKMEKMDLIIQKAVELGVYRIVPVLTQRTVVQLDGSSTEKKMARWNRIAVEAAKQCGRACVPEIMNPLTLKEILRGFECPDLAIALYENEQKKCLKEVLKCYNINDIGNIALFIGPEGGFAEEEADAMHQAGIQTASLGNRILRTETAAISGISIIMYEMGEMQ